MFILLSDKLYQKICLGILAVIFELTKVWDLENLLITRKIIYLISYFFKVLLSLAASAGLLLTIVNSKIEIKENVNKMKIQKREFYEEKVKYWENEINSISETIELLNENLERNPQGYGLASKAFISQIEKMQTRKNDYLIELSDTKNALFTYNATLQNNEIQTSNDMFSEIGKIFSISSDIVKYIVFSLIMILIEISIFLTHPFIVSQLIIIEANMYPKKIKSISNNNQLKPNLKGVNIARLIAIQQSEREVSDQSLYTQKELASKLNVTPEIIGNTVRRYVNPIMRKYNYDTFQELSIFLNNL